ncbi:AcfA family outer membrane beta-barrel protein [Vibrio sp. T20]|uniref:AcfA family outer membrane beta-barrel protein n=1 Tax=Vibrio sp. T20 TaxID=2588450 RepID=UPI0011B61846|nr:AcfA family outer membrane beta-barrel protein [Vibrio sp. T20]
MKKLFLIGVIVAVPTVALANPYVSLNYGFNNTDQAISTPSNLVPMATTDEDSASFGGAVGYKFNESWALELGYRHFSNEGESELYITDTELYEESIEASSEINVHQLTLKPIYSFHLTEKLDFKLGAGVSLTQYQYSSKVVHETDEEKFPEDIETSAVLHNENSEEWIVGGIASLGLAYNFTNHFALGAEVSYQADEKAQNINAGINASYTF